MPPDHQSDHVNLLLKRCPEIPYLHLKPLLESVALNTREALSVKNEPIRYAYFVESGIASVVASREDGREIEVGIYGRDGMSGFAALLGSELATEDHYMQLAGTAYRVAIEALLDLVEEFPDLRKHLLQFVHVFAVQIAQTALATSNSTVEERLARWLLMCHDRIDGNTLNITHQFLALMLSVRRPGVTEAIHLLESKMLIRAQRAQITIRDRPALEKLAGASYGVPESEYRRLFGTV